METQETQRAILYHYGAVDFSLLPLQFEELWHQLQDKNESESRHSHCYSELARFAGPVGLYDEFVATYKKETTRNVRLRDQFDLAAFMIRNSKLATSGLVDCSDVSVSLALKYIDDQTIFLPSDGPGENAIWNNLRLSLEAECQRGAEELFRDQVVIHRYLWERDRERLRILSAFLVLYNKGLSEPQPFLHMDHSYESIVPGSLFHRLPLCDQFEIADDTWKTVDLERRSVLYLVVIKLLFDCLMERTLHTRHPYLVARWCNPLEIAQHIVRQAQDSEPSIRMMANSYALVSGIGAPELTSKCLTLLSFSKKGMISIGL